MLNHLSPLVKIQELLDSFLAQKLLDIFAHLKRICGFGFARGNAGRSRGRSGDLEVKCCR